LGFIFPSVADAGGNRARCTSGGGSTLDACGLDADLSSAFSIDGMVGDEVSFSGIS
jgi:hypothetical protein